MESGSHNLLGDVVTTGQAALKYYTPKEVAELTGQSAAAVNFFFLMKGMKR